MKNNQILVHYLDKCRKQMGKAEGNRESDFHNYILHSLYYWFANIYVTIVKNAFV